MGYVGLFDVGIDKELFDLFCGYGEGGGDFGIGIFGRVYCDGYFGGVGSGDKQFYIDVYVIVFYVVNYKFCILVIWSFCKME